MIQGSGIQRELGIEGDRGDWVEPIGGEGLGWVLDGLEEVLEVDSEVNGDTQEYFFGREG